IHLLGKRVGPSPEEQEPIAKLQLSRAAARVIADLNEGKQRGLRRIMWSNGPLNDGEPAMQDAAGSAERLGKFGLRLESDRLVIDDSIGRFIDFLTDHLVNMAPSPRQPPKIKADAKVYLHHSREDADYAFGLAEALQNQQVETIFPAFDGPKAQRL